MLQFLIPFTFALMFIPNIDKDNAVYVKGQSINVKVKSDYMITENLSIGYRVYYSPTITKDGTYIDGSFTSSEKMVVKLKLNF